MAGHCSFVSVRSSALPPLFSSIYSGCALVDLRAPLAARASNGPGRGRQLSPRMERLASIASSSAHCRAVIRPARGWRAWGRPGLAPGSQGGRRAPRLRASAARGARGRQAAAPTKSDAAVEGKGLGGRLAQLFGELERGDPRVRQKARPPHDAAAARAAAALTWKRVIF